MFEMLGLTPQNHLQSFSAYYSWGCGSQFTTLGEKQNGQDRVTIEENLASALKENNISSLYKSPIL
jgi:hypothetical protein